MEAFISTNIQVSSPAFGQEENIPVKYTCDGDNINPTLIITDFPSGVRSLALIMDDPDAPGGTFTHWLLWNIMPSETIGEGSAPGIEGLNSSQKSGYTGPCPPDGTHRYYFRIYALDTMLDLPAGAQKEELLLAMDGHILGTGELMGLYSRV